MADVTVIEPEHMPPLNSLSIIRDAMQKDISGEQLALFVQSVERLEKMKAEKSFHAAFAALQKELPSVLKGKTNGQTNSLYAELQAIQDVIVPVYTSHGFALSFGTGDAPVAGEIRILGKLSHAEGHSVEYKVDLPPDEAGIKGNVNKTPMHARASTLSYGQRYLTVLIFSIRLTTKVDNDGNREVDRLMDDQIAAVEKLIVEKNANRGKLLAHVSGTAARMPIKLVKEIPQALYGRTITALQGMKGKVEA